MKRVLFLDDCDLQQAHDPLAYLIEIPDEINSKMLRAIETSNRFPNKSWKNIINTVEMKHRFVSAGRKSQYDDIEFDETFTLDYND